MPYSKMVVGFLDILGTRADQSFDSKYRVHRAFHESINDVQARDRQEASYYRRVASFSDCAYIFHGFREGVAETEEAQDLLIQAALFNTTLATIRLLNDGYLVRGGISFGDAYHDDLSFFGPAVEKAFILESQKAVTPRILIEDSLGSRAKSFSDNAHKENFSEKNPDFALLPKRSYIPELVLEKNGSYYLNVLYILEMESRLQLGEMEFTHDGLKKTVMDNINAQIRDHPWESPVRPKLEWMEEYLNNSVCSLEQPGTSVAITL
ncbi:hypothetical protein [Salinisphaera hydrothermalis]|uniref:hypothetical protein n=1 Tax=Salinisphaera hydrothermalis TaxID=563188 RepID=UPI00333F1AFC